MLNITPKMQSSMGEASLIFEDGVLYITDVRTWMLVIPNPWSSFPHQVLELAQEFEKKGQRHRLDWRVLNAKEVDYANLKFLPHRARKHADLGLDTYNHPSVEQGTLRQAAEETMSPSIYGDLVDLSAMFTAGEARAVYAADSTKQKDSNRAFAKEENAETYIFRFDDKILGVNGAQFRAFRDMGFVVVCPKKTYAERAIPPLGLRWQGGHDAFGYFMPMAKAGVFEDDQGRRLFEDASMSSWEPEEVSTRELCNPPNYLFDRDQKARTLGDILDDNWGVPDLRRAVSSLMWKGWEARAIEDYYETGRYSAYLVLSDRMQEMTATHITELRDIVELGAGVSGWRAQSIESSLKRHCNTYEAMAHLVELDLGLLPEAVALLDAALAGEERTALGA